MSRKSSELITIVDIPCLSSSREATFLLMVVFPEAGNPHSISR